RDGRVRQRKSVATLADLFWVEHLLLRNELVSSEDDKECFHRLNPADRIPNNDSLYCSYYRHGFERVQLRSHRRTQTSHWAGCTSSSLLSGRRGLFENAYSYVDRDDLSGRRAMGNARSLLGHAKLDAAGCRGGNWNRVH